MDRTVFFGKASVCRVPHAARITPITDAQSEHRALLQGAHDNGRRAIGDGPIKTFPLRGIKDSPPYLHDGRLLTLEDTVEFFNLILETKLSEPEKADVVMFLCAIAQPHE